MFVGNHEAAERTSVDPLVSSRALVVIVNDPVDLPSESQMAREDLPSIRTQDAGLHGGATPKTSCPDRKFPITNTQYQGSVLVLEDEHLVLDDSLTCRAPL